MRVTFTLIVFINISHAYENLTEFFGDWESSLIFGDTIIPLENPSGRLVLCTIPKNGHTRWRQLAWRILGRNCSDSPHKVRFPNLKHPFFGRGFWESSSHVILVRNPYTRFISWYEDKVVRQRIIKDIYSIEEAIFRLISGNLTDVHHTRPQSAYCGQLRGLTYGAIYKVENISSWYPSFIKQFNLYNFVETGWEHCAHSFVRKRTSCFFSPESHSCESYFSQDYPVVHGKDGPCQYTSHSTCSRTPFKLTPSQAQAITRFYKDDFIRFGYPSWDGVPNNFRIM